MSVSADGTPNLSKIGLNLFGRPTVTLTGGIYTSLLIILFI